MQHTKETSWEHPGRAQVRAEHNGKCFGVDVELTWGLTKAQTSAAENDSEEKEPDLPAYASSLLQEATSAETHC